MTNAEKALQLHEEWNGKFETTPKMDIATREDLALAYTPGVAEPCKVIAKDKEAAYKYTIKANTVAVVSDPSDAHWLPAGYPMYRTFVSFRLFPQFLLIEFFLSFITSVAGYSAQIDSFLFSSRKKRLHSLRRTDCK